MVNSNIVKFLTLFGYLFDAAEEIRTSNSIEIKKSDTWAATLMKRHYNSIRQSGVNNQQINSWLQELQLFIVWIKACFDQRLTSAESDRLNGSNLSAINLHKVMEGLVGLYLPSGSSPAATYNKVTKNTILRKTIPLMLITNYTQEVPVERKKTKDGTELRLGLLKPLHATILRYLILPLANGKVSKLIPFSDSSNTRFRYLETLYKFNLSVNDQLLSPYIDWEDLSGIFAERVHESDKDQVRLLLSLWFTPCRSEDEMVYFPKPELLEVLKEIKLIEIKPLPNHNQYKYIRLLLSDDDFIYLYYATFAAHINQTRQFARRWVFRHLARLFFEGLLYYYATRIYPQCKKRFNNSFLDNPFLIIFDEEIVFMRLIASLIEPLAAIRKINVCAAGTKTAKKEVSYQFEWFLHPQLTNIIKEADFLSFYEEATQNKIF